MNIRKTFLEKRLGGDFLDKRRNSLRHQEQKSPMTICAAAISGHGDKEVVLAISDRMITNGDIEFEDNHSKIWVLSPRIACLFSGESVFHHMIRSATHRTIIADGITDVGEVADLYALNFIALRRKRAEKKYLAPINLDCDTFLSRQHELQPNQAESLIMHLIDEKLGVQGMIVGTDKNGAHIYTIGTEKDENCQPICHDGRDFVAIGTGFRQFETQFMTMGYTRAWGSLYCLQLMISSKRKAEISPGVGTATDAVIISEDVKEYIPEAIRAIDRYNKEIEDAVYEKRQEVHKKIKVDPLLVGGILPSPEKAS